MDLLETGNYDSRGRKTYYWDLEVERKTNYFDNYREALSQLLYATLGGHANLTLSAGLGYWLTIGDARGHIFAPIVNAIFFDKHHCINAWINKT